MPTKLHYAWRPLKLSEVVVTYIVSPIMNYKVETQPGRDGLPARSLVTVVEHKATAKIITPL